MPEPRPLVQPRPSRGPRYWLKCKNDWHGDAAWKAVGNGFIKGGLVGLLSGGVVGGIRLLFEKVAAGAADWAVVKIFAAFPNFRTETQVAKQMQFADRVGRVAQPSPHSGPSPSTVPGLLRAGAAFLSAVATFVEFVALPFFSWPRRDGIRSLRLSVSRARSIRWPGACMFLKSSRRLPQAKLEELWTARDAGDPEAFLALARRASERYPVDPDALIELAQALSQNGRYGEAADFALLAEGRTTDGAVPVLAAWMLIYAERHERAGVVLDKVLATDPSNPVVKNEALYLRGTTLEALGESNAAEQYLRAAVDGDDQLPLYLVGLATFLVQHHRRDEALDLVDQAAAISDAEARDEALSDLADLGLSR